MSDIKWVRINTSMFDDEKIKIIETMPEGDTILIIWIKLLTQTGRKNMNGYLLLTENIPYTDEMLATLFNRPLNTVRLALETFKSFGMIDWGEMGEIEIVNWEKHQNVEGMQKIREDNRKRQEKYRLKQRMQLGDGQQPEEIPFKKIVAYLNEKAERSYRASSEKTKKVIRARWREGFRYDDFVRVIDNKANDWKSDERFDKFLRPETLFGTKFEGYLNESGNYAPNQENAFNDFLNDDEDE